MNESQKIQIISSTTENITNEIELNSSYLYCLTKLLNLTVSYISSDSKDPTEINGTIQGLPSSSNIGLLPNDFTADNLYNLISEIIKEQNAIKYTQGYLHEVKKAVNTRICTPSQGFYEINKSAVNLDAVKKTNIGIPLPIEWEEVGTSILGDANNASGTNISLSGDGKRIAFTTPEYNDDTGHVKVYENIGNMWIQIGATIQGELQQDSQYGLFTSLSMDGNTVAIGWPAHQSNDDSQADYRAGHVKIYKYDCKNNTWIQFGSNINGIEFGRSGSWLQLSNNGLKVVIGEPRFGNDELLIEGTDQYQPFFGGVIRIFEHNGFDWGQLGNDIIGQRDFDEFGGCVTISNNGLIVAGSSVYFDSSPSGTEEDWSGHTRIFEFKCGDWVQLGDSIIGEAVVDNSGQSIYLSGDGKRIAISAPNNDGDGDGKTHNSDYSNNYNSGHVRVFEYNGSEWVQLGTDINNENQSDGTLGIPVCLSEDGNILAMGVPASGNNKGIIKVFEYNGSDWLQLGDNLEGTLNNELFGFSISISEDGRTLASGAPGSKLISMYKLK